jgi:drug/metabolite transporter (DMT)-like permease
MLLSVVLGSALVVLVSLAWQAAAGRASMGAVSTRFVGIAFADSTLISIVYAATVIAPRYASSAEVGLVHPLEAILGPVWVYVGIGEAPSRWTIIGGALLIGSLIGHEVWGCQSEARSGKRAAARDIAIRAGTGLPVAELRVVASGEGSIRREKEVYLK